MFERSRDRKGAAHQTVPLRSFLVPKLCLGTLSAKLRFALPSMAGQADAKQSFAKAVPKQSLGTRKCPAFLKLLLRERPIKPLPYGRGSESISQQDSNHADVASARQWKRG